MAWLPTVMHHTTSTSAICSAISKQANNYNYKNMPKKQLGCLICRTHQHYHRQWLPNTEWSNSRRWASARDIWLWCERFWEKEGFKTKSGKTRIQQPSGAALVCVTVWNKQSFCSLEAQMDRLPLAAWPVFNGNTGSIQRCYQDQVIVDKGQDQDHKCQDQDTPRPRPRSRPRPGISKPRPGSSSSRSRTYRLTRHKLNTIAAKVPRPQSQLMWKLLDEIKKQKMRKMSP